MNVFMQEQTNKKDNNKKNIVDCPLHAQVFVVRRKIVASTKEQENYKKRRELFFATYLIEQS